MGRDKASSMSQLNRRHRNVIKREAKRQNAEKEEHNTAAVALLELQLRNALERGEESRAEAEALQSQLEQAKGEAAAAQSHLEHAEGEAAAAQSHLEQSKGEAAAARSQLAETNQQLMCAKDQNMFLQTILEEKKEETHMAHNH